MVARDSILVTVQLSIDRVVGCMGGELIVVCRICLIHRLDLHTICRVKCMHDCADGLGCMTQLRLNQSTWSNPEETQSLTRVAIIVARSPTHFISIIIITCRYPYVIRHSVYTSMT